MARWGGVCTRLMRAAAVLTILATPFPTGSAHAQAQGAVSFGEAVGRGGGDDPGQAGEFYYFYNVVELAGKKSFKVQYPRLDLRTRKHHYAHWWIVPYH